MLTIKNKYLLPRNPSLIQFLTQAHFLANSIVSPSMELKYVLHPFGLGFREVGEKLDKVGKGLDSVQKNTKVVNAKVEVLSREREERPKEFLVFHRGKRGRRGEEPKWEEVDMAKYKIPQFLGNCKPLYLDWELKEEQILGCFDLHGRVVVRLVTLEFGEYALGLGSSRLLERTDQSWADMVSADTYPTRSRLSANRRNKVGLTLSQTER
ncbi:hypothetical protein CR513_10528, partial [Mucuna pruriens]